MEEKKTFKTLFILLAVTLMFLPVVMTFNNFLAAFIESTRFYKLIQNTLLPWEIRIVGVVLEFLGIGVRIGGGTLYLTQGLRKEAIYIGWNCLGWQSLLLYLVSLVVGFQGNFTIGSKLVCAAIGFLGIFLLNIFRMAVVAIGIFYISDVFALVFHNYFAALLTVAWLFVFWWFAYAFILEKRREG